MLEMFNMAQIRCPVSFFAEIFAVFQMKKSQINTKNDKNLRDFMHFFQLFDGLCGF